MTSLIQGLFKKQKPHGVGMHEIGTWAHLANVQNDHSTNIGSSQTNITTQGNIQIISMKNMISTSDLTNYLIPMSFFGKFIIYIFYQNIDLMIWVVNILR
jgi:hypothetical protein